MRIIVEFYFGVEKDLIFLRLIFVSMELDQCIPFYFYFFPLKGNLKKNLFQRNVIAGFYWRKIGKFHWN